MKKIAVVTGSRAEFGILLNLIRELHESPDFDLHLYVTGSHLSSDFGLTVREVETNRIPIKDKIEAVLTNSPGDSVAKAVGRAASGFTDAFRRDRPDAVIVLGDRYEIFGVAQAAAFSEVPLIHIHGGETTEGAFDEFIRHSITKMAQIHFVSAEDYRQRVIQLGENPERVFNVGAPGLDQLAGEKVISLDELSEQIGFALKPGFLLFTYHPETLGGLDPVVALEESLKALDTFPDRQVVMTYPNSDLDSTAMIQALEKYRDANPKRVFLTPSLGRQRYITAMRYCGAVVGNSSSGIIETPFLKKPTVNIGSRQRGRVMSPSIVTCDSSKASIVSAIEEALAMDPVYLEKLPSLYGDGTATANIMAILRKLPEMTVRKSFFDLKAERTL